MYWYDITTDNKKIAGEGVGLHLERGIFEGPSRFLGILQIARTKKKKTKPTKNLSDGMSHAIGEKYHDENRILPNRIQEYWWYDWGIFNTILVRRKIWLS